jgi:hypothetical protein
MLILEFKEEAVKPGISVRIRVREKCDVIVVFELMAET